MKFRNLILATILIATVGTADATAQQKSKKGKTPTADTTIKKSEAPKGSIEAVLKKGAKGQSGLFNVVEQEGKYYFLLPRKDVGRDYLLVTRISQAPAELRSGFTGYAGDMVGEQMIRFALSPDDKTVFLQSILTRELPRDTTGDMYDNVMKSNFQPLVAAFEIKGANKVKDTLLIDVTDFLVGDNDLTSLNGRVKNALNISSYQKDRSYIAGVKSFPINTEIKTVKTYNNTPQSTRPGARPGSPRPVTFELNTSIVALPEVPMQPRYADNRVGYFTERYVDFDKNPQGIKNLSLITRWRLEPKPSDEAAYKRGELVEPAEPIVFYIDPSTPKAWVPYLIQGVNDWEPVFRKAGFKNAIMGLEAPVGDSTWSLEDARHSAIVYKPSTIPNASGPHVHDPRTGQILESHINWYHNVMLLLRNWYMIQVGPNDPRAQQLTFPEELMGELVRFVSSHEVGHTLGLRHNFGSTSLTPVDSLRSASFIEKYGHTPSIMDYSRFNYVVQPEDGIKPELQYPRIQDYDEWAIEWGYRRFLDLKTPEAEATKLNEWIIEAQKNPRLWFGHEQNPNDPRSQSEDLGDNQMKANELGIKNLKRVISGIPQWTKEPNAGYSELAAMHEQVVTQYSRYVGHVAKWIGGIYENPRTVEQGADVYSYVEPAKQKEAMAWLNKNFFTAPTWLFDKEIFQRTGLNTVTLANTIYAANLRKIVNERIMTNLINGEAINGKAASYTISNYFADLNKAIFGATPNVIGRVMQKNYVDILLALVPVANQQGNFVNSDVPAVIINELRSIQSRLAASQNSDAVVAAHNKYIIERIKEKLDKK